MNTTIEKYKLMRDICDAMPDTCMGDEDACESCAAILAPPYLIHKDWRDGVELSKEIFASIEAIIGALDLGFITQAEAWQEFIKLKKQYTMKASEEKNEQKRTD